VTTHAASSQAEITLALVGGTHIHTPDFVQRMADADYVTTKYIWDPIRETAESRQEVAGGEIVDHVNQIYDDPEVDGIVICSETFRHVDLIGPAIEAGKHLFVEKPVGMNGAEGTRIAHKVNQSGVIFQTGYFNRSFPRNRMIKNLIEEGAFGKITRLRLSNVHSGALGGWFDDEWRWMADLEQAGVGAFGDMGSHAFDLLLWFLSEDKPTSCTGYIDQAIARYPGCDEYGEGMVKFASGAVGTVAGGWVDRANPNEVEIFGTDGHARVTNGDLYLTIPDMDADGSEPWGDLPDELDHPIELFFRAVAGESDLPLIKAGEAAQVSRVISAIYRAHETGSWARL
jgi:predicted dehydrogenase